MDNIDWLGWLAGVVTPIIVIVAYLATRADVKDLRSRMDRINENLSSRIDKIENLFGKLVAYLQGERKEPLSSVFVDNLNPPSGKIEDSKTVNANSPISLTERGLKIAEKLKAGEVVEKYRKHILLPLDANKLAIQDMCFDFAMTRLRGILTAEERKVVDDEIYEQKGVHTDVLVIYGILFRNSFFKERGIPVPEIPAPDSNKSPDN